MALTLWILLVTVAMTGGALAAMTTVPARRGAAMLTATVAVAGLLVVLGLDLPAAVWLSVGGAAALLSVPAGSQPDQGSAPAGPHARRGTLLGGGVAAGLLFAILYRTALQVDWRPSVPESVTGQVSVVGGTLLVEDVALLMVAVLLLTVALAVVGRRRAGRADPVEPEGES